jgi:large subunit ribosomal protein L4
MVYHVIMQGAVSSLAHRRLSTSNVTFESTDGSFPSDLLTAKNVVTPQREIGTN